MDNQTDPIPEITPTELKDRLDQGRPPALLDVREPFERDIADLPELGQHRIPVREIEERLGEIDPGAELVVYCRSGARSHRVAGFLRERGFEAVFNLRGGVLGWREDVDPSLREY